MFVGQRLPWRWNGFNGGQLEALTFSSACIDRKHRRTVRPVCFRWCIDLLCSNLIFDESVSSASRDPRPCRNNAFYLARLLSSDNNFIVLPIKDGNSGLFANWIIGGKWIKKIPITLLNHRFEKNSRKLIRWNFERSLYDATVQRHLRRATTTGVLSREIPSLNCHRGTRAKLTINRRVKATERARYSGIATPVPLR